ncbi:MAG: M20/M25/M40 family metallo-hydrolase, partial [Bacteroidales bacterium]|nr:M20/M25/M40 family metallo-hydrolase [Bacteroidales bacterium]
MTRIKTFIDTNRDSILEELFELIRIPSISAKPENKPDMIRAAEFLRDSLKKAGADRADVFPTAGNPVVYAEKIISKKLPTVLVYGHYDVQPAEPFDLWNSPPFEPEVRDGRIWARGADDDKGQLFMHVKAFEFMTTTGALP